MPQTGRFRSVLGRNLVLLSVVSLLNDFSTEMVFPLLPYFILTLGGTAIAVGLMEGAADSIAAFLRFFSGRWSDRLGQRKPPMIGGYAASSIIKLFYGFAAHVSQVVLIRGFDRVGKGIREAPRDAVISESVPRAYWGFAYGFHRMMDTSGALLGPLVALVLVALFEPGGGCYDTIGSGHLRSIFFIAAIPGLLGVFLLFYVKETGTRRVQTGPQPLLPRATYRGPLARYLTVTAFYTLGNLSLAFLILRATEVHLCLPTIILLYTCFNATYAVAALPTGHLTDRIGRPPILAFAFAAFALIFGLLGIFMPASLWGLLPFFVAIGIAKAFREGNGRAFVADLTGGDVRATGFGAYHATVGALALPAGLLAGWLWQGSPRLTFFAAEAFCLVALALFVYFWRRGDFRDRGGDSGHDQDAANVDPGAQTLAQKEVR